MYTVYSDSPWLMPPDPASTALIFRRLGRPVTLKARSVVNFGASHKVYLLQSGIVATFAGGVGSYERMAAFFTTGCTLGAVKAMTHRGAQMKLAARCIFRSHLPWPSLKREQGVEWPRFFSPVAALSVSVIRGRETYPQP